MQAQAYGADDVDRQYLGVSSEALSTLEHPADAQGVIDQGGDHEAHYADQEIVEAEPGAEDQKE